MVEGGDILLSGARYRVQCSGVHPLVESLFFLSLASPERGLAPVVRRPLEQSDPQTWQRALNELAPHKMFPLLSHRLRQFGLLDAVPPEARAQLTEMHEEVRARNALLLFTLARILRLLASRGESALLMKGILFADSYYPDFSTRPMSDIDMVAERGHDVALFRLLEEAGFRPSLHHTVQEHSITFMNREGVFCDAHRTLPMFAAEPWHRIRVDVELTRIRGVKVMALEPHALVAHLVAHMHSHAPELGFVLLWMVDVAFVLRRHQAQLDFSRVRALMNNEGAWVLLLRIARMLYGMGEEIDARLITAARALPPMTVSAALRQRRITPWGLPSPLGWVRLAAHGLGLHHSERPTPSLEDLVLWPLDELSERIAPQIARVNLR